MSNEFMGLKKAIDRNYTPIEEKTGDDTGWKDCKGKSIKIGDTLYYSKPKDKNDRDIKIVNPKPGNDGLRYKVIKTSEIFILAPSQKKQQGYLTVK